MSKTFKEAFDEVMNDFREGMKPGGEIFETIKNTVEELQKDNADRMTELEKQVEIIGKQPSPHNTFVPESTGAASDHVDTGFM